MINIVGTIKIDNTERRQMFAHNLESMRPIAHLLRWRLNIAGCHAVWARDMIASRWKDIEITFGDDLPTYHRQRRQMDLLPPNSNVFLWQEDHWFLCPHPPLFLHLWEAYKRSGADVLTITHLTVSWGRKHLLPIVLNTDLFTLRHVDSETQRDVWAQYPGAFLTGVPAIYRWEFANDILEFRRDIMSKAAIPNFELSANAEEGPKFLRSRSFTELIPKFHVFREVAKGSGRHPASCDMDNAAVWLALRDRGDMHGGYPTHFEGW